MAKGILRPINEIIVRLGHGVFKKKETEALHIKTDSYVCQSNVHFPTDYNLLWDSARKCLDTITHLIENDSTLKGWRKIKDWHTRLKTGMLLLSRAQASKAKEERVTKAVCHYLRLSRDLATKVESFVINNVFDYLTSEVLVKDLCYFLEMLEKHINLVNRRLVLKQTIPTCEKIYSIFETYTEWIAKGKMRPNVELGKRVNIVTDQYHLILDWKVSDHTADVDMLIPLVDRVLWKHKHQVASISADKGYFKTEYRELVELFIPQVITIPLKSAVNSRQNHL